MSGASLEFSGVWKKFRRGEDHDSLRDLIPGVVRRLWSPDRRGQEEREFWAVRDVSFAVRKGEAVGIIGPNGAGKSTILKIISRILRPNKGDVHVEGRVSALIEVGAGFHHDLTGRENVYLNGYILGMKRREIDTKFAEIVEFSGVEKFIDTPVKRYSSGMFARLGFAVAAHVDPDILVVDEVLSVGDAAFRVKCARRMFELVKRDVAVVCVSHNMELIRLLCTKCLVLADGQVQFVGSAAEAVERYHEVLRVRRTSLAVTAPFESIRREIGRIERVLVQADDGAGGGGEVDAGGPMSVLVEYEVYRGVERIGISVQVNLPTGLGLVTWNTMHDQLELSGKPGRYTVRLKVPRLGLLPNDYRMAVWLMAIEDGRPPAVDVHFGQIIVRGEPTDALVSIDHVWLGSDGG